MDVDRIAADLAAEIRRPGVPCDAAERLAAGDVSAAEVVMVALWGGAEPPERWWRTDAGFAVAEALGERLPGWTQARAALFLGVVPQTVATVLGRGTDLVAHSDGGVLACSVIGRWRRLNLES